MATKFLTHCIGRLLQKHQNYAKISKFSSIKSS